MSRKQLKSILNTAARQVGRTEAKEQFGNRKAFVKLPGAFMHTTTATLFKA